jgi:hypothetical protein
MPKKKQITIETIEYIQRSINDLLQSNISQGDKRMLCKMMEKILKDMKQKDDDYQYLHWNKYGKQDWKEDRKKHLTKLDIGDTIKIPQEYITGPDYDGSDNFTSDIQGEWSRVYY